MSYHIMGDGTRILIEKGETGLYYATSPDHNGLLVAKLTPEQALENVEQALKDLFKAVKLVNWSEA